MERLSGTRSAPLCRDDFEFGKVLGTGSFGRVCLAVHKEKGLVCAVKALSKSHIIKNQQARAASRPYLHPIITMTLTQTLHPHQTLT